MQRFSRALLLASVPAQARERRRPKLPDEESGRVTYTTTERLYLDCGRRAGLAPE